MHATVKIGDHVLVVNEVQMDAGDARHELIAWIGGPQGTGGVAPAQVTVGTEMEAAAVLMDFLAPEPDPDGNFARHFPALMP